MKTKAEIEAALLPNGLPAVGTNEWPKERAGAVNAYVCDLCKGLMVVVLLDWGTTPFLVGCSARVMPPGCKRDRYCRGTMQSTCYRVPPLVSGHVSHAWYRPDDSGPAVSVYLEEAHRRAARADAPVEAIEASDVETRAHVERGGLLLRELTEDERQHWQRAILRVVHTVELPRPGSSSHPPRFA